MVSQKFWNIFFSLFFAFILAILYLDFRRRNISLPDFSFYELAIMTLAVQRLTRLFVYDKILKFFRESFSNKGWQGTVKDLLTCPWCTSMWFAPFVLYLYLIIPEIMLVYVVLALSSVASFLQILINAIGHWGEKHNR